MRTLLTFFVFLPFLSFAQVGVNTTTPNAALDIQSTNNGVLIPRVQLTDALDIATVVNPAGGVLAKSTLVYNVGSSGIAPDNVIDGFYYWNGVRWMPISASTPDHDWYKVGTTTAPTAISDNIFHSGKVAIGKNTANANLDIFSSTLDASIVNELNNPDNNDQTTIFNTISGLGTSPHTGVWNWLFGKGNIIGSVNQLNSSSDGTGFIRGVETSISGSGNTEQSGVWTLLESDGDNIHTGIYSSLGGAGNGRHIGSDNLLYSSGTGTKYGTRNIIADAAGGQHFGVYSEVLKPGSNFAGYFRGKVAIGTNATIGIDDYIFPSSRGTNGQIMQTDGAGNVTWQNASFDHDWYEEGTTTPPNAITDNMFHTGKVAIGKNTATSTLDIETNGEDVGINNVLNKDTDTGSALGVDTVLNGLTNDPSIALRNTFYGTGLGNKTGVLNYADATVQGNKYGQLNILSDDSIINTNSLTGVSNTLTSDGIGSNIGITNLQYGSNTATGVFYGMDTHIQNDGSSPSTGVNNLLDSFSAGSGGSFGMINTISGYKTGGKFGVSNWITSEVVDSLIGFSNNITSTLDGGTITGIENTLDANSDTPIFGNYNQLGGTGNSNVTAVHSFITNAGDGQHTGIFSNLSGAGIGRKYGTYSTIIPTAGGQHFGVFAQVLKPGNNFAGYFNGRVAIGSNISFGIDDYVFPTSRGTNGQIMQTDGVGNLSWQNPSTFAWSLTGNTVTAATDFLGSTNNADVIIKRNNILAGFLGSFNTSFGQGALLNYDLSPFTLNTAFGRSALAGDSNKALNTGGANTAIGVDALFYNTSGSSNTAVGFLALSSNKANNGSTAVGFQAMIYADNRTTGRTAANTAVGYNALSGSIVPANNTGIHNTAIGYQSLENNTSGSYNTIIGTNAGASITSAVQNVAIGNNALDSNITSGGNTAVGYDALQTTTGDYNTAFGNSALFSLGVGTSNCAFGYNALTGLTSGINNIGIGTNAVVPLSTGSNQIRMGNNAITFAGIQVAWTITSDKRWKSDIQASNLGLNFINKLKPVSYIRKNDESKKTEYGFIAQELDQTLNEFGTSNSGIINKDDAGMLSVRYNDLLAPIVKAIQELKTENDALKEQNEALHNRLKALENK